MKSYTIRLKNSNLSNILANDSFNSALNFGLDAKYFDAIQPELADETLKKYGVVLNYTHANRHLGTRGCLASHYSLWIKTMEIAEPILILEHDGIVIKDIHGIVGMVENACHLDPCNIFDSNYNLDIERNFGAGVQEYLKINRPNTTPGAIGKETSEHFRGAYGYILTPNGAEKLTTHWKNNPATVADMCISKAVMKLQISLSTHVRLHSFYKNETTIFKMSTRKNSSL